MEKRKRRILVITPKIPKPDQNSGDRRFVAILEMLARTNQVDLCIDVHPFREDPPVTKADMDRYRKICRGIGVNILSFFPLPNPLSLFGWGYDVVFFEFYYMLRRYGRIVKLFAPSSKTIVDSVDIHFLRAKSAASLGTQMHAPSDEDIEYEVGAYRQADATIVVTREDAEGLSQASGIRSLFLIPNIVGQRCREDRQRKQIVIFVGGFAHEPNIDAVLWFTTEVWPKVLHAVPAACFQVIGSNAPPAIIALQSTPGVQLVGYVPETGIYLDDAMVSVAPIRYGAGMKGKVNEAMASGLPVVTTFFGAQGLGAKDKEHLLLADDPVTFASLVISALLDTEMAKRVGLAGQALTRSICSPEIVEITVNKMLDEVAPPGSLGFVDALKNVGFQIALSMRGMQSIRAFLRRTKLHAK